jgi:hypothetical protein
MYENPWKIYGNHTLCIPWENICMVHGNPWESMENA